MVLLSSRSVAYYNYLQGLSDDACISQCPFCVDAPVKENGKKCVGVCRNPQNVPGKAECDR